MVKKKKLDSLIISTTSGIKACHHLRIEVAFGGSLRARQHAEDPAVFTWHPHFSRCNVENMGLHHVHPQEAPTDGENGVKRYLVYCFF